MFLFAMLTLGKRILDWILDWAGVSIKRHQSREDVLEAEIKALGARQDGYESRLSRIEELWRVNHKLVHSAADGIDTECDKAIPDMERIRFYSRQLRAMQTLEEIWSKPVAAESAAAPAST